MATVYTVRSKTGRVVANCASEAEAKTLVAQLKRRNSRSERHSHSPGSPYRDRVQAITRDTTVYSPQGTSILALTREKAAKYARSGAWNREVRDFALGDLVSSAELDEAIAELSSRGFYNMRRSNVARRDAATASNQDYRNAVAINLARRFGLSHSGAERLIAMYDMTVRSRNSKLRKSRFEMPRKSQTPYETAKELMEAHMRDRGVGPARRWLFRMTGT